MDKRQLLRSILFDVLVGILLYDAWKTRKELQRLLRGPDPEPFDFDDSLIIDPQDHTYCDPGLPCLAGQPFAAWLERRQRKADL